MTRPSSNGGRSFAEVTIGDRLGDTQVVASLTSMVMYAAATWDFHRAHYDREFARSAGFEAPVVDGQMIGALLAREVMRWGGPDSFLRMLDYRVSAMVYAGDRICVAGEVIDKKTEAGHPLVVWRLQIHKPDGAQVVKDAQAVIEIP